MDYEIRRARRDEAPLLADLGAATFTATFGHLYSAANLSKFLRKSHSVDAYRAMLADSDHAVWVAARQDGALVAYAVAGPCGLPAPNMPARSGELMRLYLASEAQGGGLGGRLLDIALDHLARNFDRTYLSVYAYNVRAQRLYESRGFVKIHDYFYEVGDHLDPEWIMERKEC